MPIILFTSMINFIGIATSFFNDKNINLIRDLVPLLTEANQEIPDWLDNLHASNRHGGSRKPASKGRFAGGFGARDYRQSGGGPPSRSNGSYGGRPSSYGGNLK